VSIVYILNFNACKQDRAKRLLEP